MASSKVLMNPMEVQKLRSSIHHLVEEQNRSNSKLIGVQVLTDQLEHKNEECNVLKVKLKQLEVLLSRAENRISQLSMKGGSTKSGGVITPGVSKRLFEAITRENTKLKLTLEHVLNKLPNGIDLAVENRDLHDLTIALKAELEQDRKETEELRDALRAVETEDTMALQEQVARLTAQITQIERRLKANHVYCESVVTENERLQANIEAVKSERITQLASLKKLANEHPAIKEIIDLAWTSGDDVDGQNKDIEKYTKEIESLNKQVDDFKEQRAKSFEESKKYYDEYARQLQEMRNTNAMLHEELEQVKNQFQEVNMVKELLEGQCKDFENDFKMERQEKEKLDQDLKRVLNQNQELQQENKALKKDNERIRQMIKEEFERKNKKTVSPPVQPPQQHVPQIKRWTAPTTHAATGYTPPHFNPMKHTEQVCSDGPGKHFTSYLECPVCKRILPPNEMEEHLNDCDRRR